MQLRCKRCNRPLLAIHSYCSRCGGPLCYGCSPDNKYCRSCDERVQSLIGNSAVYARGDTRTETEEYNLVTLARSSVCRVEELVLESDWEQRAGRMINITTLGYSQAKQDLVSKLLDLGGVTCLEVGDHSACVTFEHIYVTIRVSSCPSTITVIKQASFEAAEAEKLSALLCDAARLLVEAGEGGTKKKR